MANCYSVGIQTFENIRKDGYLYIDKTKILYITQVLDLGISLGILHGSG